MTTLKHLLNLPVLLVGRLASMSTRQYILLLALVLLPTIGLIVYARMSTPYTTITIKGGDLNCDAFTLELPPGEPPYVLPGSSFTLLLSANGYSTNRFSYLAITPDTEPSSGYPTIRSLSGADFSPGWTTLSVGPHLVNPDPEEEHLLSLTWRVPQITPLGTELEARVIAESPSLRVPECPLTLRMPVRLPLPAMIHSPPITQLRVSDPHPSPGDVIVVTASIHNPNLTTLNIGHGDFQFDPAPHSDVDWMEPLQGSTRLLYSSAFGFEETYYEQPTEGHSFLVPPGTTLTLAFDARVLRIDDSPHAFHPTVCVGRFASNRPDESTSCDSVTVTPAPPGEAVELTLWLDSSRFGRDGPIVATATVRNHSGAVLDDAVLAVNLPVVLRYIEGSGSISHRSPSDWTFHGVSAQGTPSGWPTAGLALPPLTPGSQLHIRFALDQRSEFVVGQDVILTANLTSESTIGDVATDTTLLRLPALRRVDISGNLELRRSLLVATDQIDQIWLDVPCKRPISRQEANRLFGLETEVKLCQLIRTEEESQFPVVGSFVHYYLTIRNNGAVPVEGAHLAMALPSGSLSFGTSVLTDAGWSRLASPGDSEGYEMPSIAPGEELRVRVVMAVMQYQWHRDGDRSVEFHAWMVEDGQEGAHRLHEGWSTKDVIRDDNTKSDLEEVWDRAREPDFLILEGVVVLAGIGVAYVMSRRPSLWLGVPLGIVGASIGYFVLSSQELLFGLIGYWVGHMVVGYMVDFGLPHGLHMLALRRVKNSVITNMAAKIMRTELGAWWSRYDRIRRRDYSQEDDPS